MKDKKVKFTNENAKKIYSSIEKSRYIWRTLKGISKEINIPIAQIQPNIEEMKLSGAIIVSSKANRKGEMLYTTKIKYYSKKNILSRVISVLADEVK